MTLERPVNPRARRTALMVASVPELTSRTSSTEVREMISRARSTSPSVGVPKLRPRVAASRTASTISGWACPWIMGPHEQTRSM